MNDKMYKCNLNSKEIKAIFELLSEKYECVRNDDNKDKEEFRELEGLFVKFCKYDSLLNQNL